MRGRLLSRVLDTETVGVEPYSSVDGQGAPSYGASEDVTAHAVEETEHVIAADGSEVRTTLTLYVPGGESPLPVVRDRVTRDGTAYIVIDRAAPKDFRGTTDHVRVRCMEEKAS